MAGTHWTSVVRRILTGEFRSRAAHRRAGDSIRRAGRRPAPRAEPAAELKLASKPQTLDRMVAVRPNSIAVVFDPSTRPGLSFPGEMLKPGMFPRLRPLQVVVVNTGAVSLDVTVGPLITVDGHAVDSAKIRVVVQLNDERPVRRRCASWPPTSAPISRATCCSASRTRSRSEVHAAVRMNRLADLRRQTLQVVLADRWMPRAFAGGALLRRDFSVLDAPWPEAPTAAHPGGRSRARTARSRRAAGDRGAAGSLDLTMDARLRRLWTEHADAELRGIAGAKANNTSTVIAVPTREPGAYEGSRLREAFGQFFDDRGVRVVAAVADSYDDIVRAWFKQVDSSPGRLVSVQSSTRRALLRIGVDSDLRSSAGAGPRSLGRQPVRP